MMFYTLVGMSRAPAFALGTAYFATLLGAPSRKSAFAGGIAGGFASPVGYDTPVLLLPMLVRWRRSPRLLGAAVLGFSLPLVLLPVFWQLKNRRPWPVRYRGSCSLILASPWNLLFAPRQGFFLFHPAGLLAGPGLVALAILGGSASRRQAAILRLG